jgi:RNA polymerase sigma factor (sigma-70 family)
MINIKAMCPTENNDADLVAASLGGNREAFRRIVERYQTLICSLAYSATGSVSQSQDMAQETFLAAWKDLAALREPHKLRAWLCRIVRNRIYKTHRRAERDPVAYATPLEEGYEVPAAQALPCEQTISREEEAILWRSLEKIPVTYREPLILFYREHQSVQNVAVAMELSEDAVKQRLSRGRKLLQEEVQAFVEKTLVRTAPGQEFCGGVLSALPFTTGSVATASASMGAKGAATAKTGLLAAGWVSLAPFLGMLAGLITQWMIVRATSTGRERRIKLIQVALFWVLVPGSAVVGEQVVFGLQHHFAWSPSKFFVVRAGFWWVYLLMLSAWLVAMYRQSLATVQSAPAAGSARPASPVKMALAAAGLQLTVFWWLIYAAWTLGDHLTAIVVTLLVVLLGTGYFLMFGNRIGAPAIRANFGYCALCCAVVVLVVNLRLDVWLAAGRAVSLAEIHQLYPLWLVPAFSVALALWVWLLVRVTGDQQTARAI